MKLPRVCVVVPAFNAARFLPVSLGSVLGLRYPPALLDVVVVDDGSADETAAVAARLLEGAAFRTEVIRQANAGPSSARNAGWRASPGEWIQFLDADDRLAPDKLEVQAAAAGAADSATACVYSPWAQEEMTPGAHAGAQPVRTPRIEGDALRALLQTENFLQLGATLIAKAWLDRVGGFDARYRFIEDVDLMVRIAMAGGAFRGVAGEGPLFFYRGHEGSLSRSDRLQFVSGCVRNARTVEGHWRQSRGTLDEQQRALLSPIYENALRVYALHDTDDFETTLGDLRRIDPDFRPSGFKLRWLSRLLGIRGAYVASGRRRIRKGLEP